MSILVTGGAGFVGSHVCDRFLAAGKTVYSLDDLRHGVDFTPEGVMRLVAPLEECPPLPGDVTHVVHCAARADVASNWASLGERASLLRDNVLGTIELLERMRGYCPRAVMIFMSTCAVYGDTDDCNVLDYRAATSPYAASKLAGEAYVQAYAYERGLPWHVLRLSCVVGARYHHGHIADFVRMAKEGHIRARSNGRGLKSFVHVLDVAEAAYRRVTRPFASGIVNLAADEPWCPRDTVDLMQPDCPVTWGTEEHGWIGDPMADASGPGVGDLPVAEGVQDALDSLGWRK